MAIATNSIRGAVSTTAMDATKTLRALVRRSRVRPRPWCNRALAPTERRADLSHEGLSAAIVAADPPETRWTVLVFGKVNSPIVQHGAVLNELSCKGWAHMRT